MKKFALIAVIVIVIAGAAAFFLLSNLNSLVAAAIEKHGSEVTDTRVGVSGVDISLREGRGSIEGLRVANPQGFSSQDAFWFGDITIDIDLASVREDPIVIDEIRIHAPLVHAEVTKTGATNIDALRKRVESHTSASAGTDGEQKKIRIKKFVFEKGSIAVDASALGVEKRTITLPEIRLNDVGGSAGARADEIAKIVVTTVTKKAMAEIGNSEVDRLIKEQLGESLTDKAKDLLKKIGN